MEVKNPPLLSYLISKSINKQRGIYHFFRLKIESMIETKSKKAKRACLFIRDFRVNENCLSDDTLDCNFHDTKD